MSTDAGTESKTSITTSKSIRKTETPDYISKYGITSRFGCVRTLKTNSLVSGNLLLQFLSFTLALLVGLDMRNFQPKICLHYIRSALVECDYKWRGSAPGQYTKCNRCNGIPCYKCIRKFKKLLNFVEIAILKCVSIVSFAKLIAFNQSSGTLSIQRNVATGATLG